MADEARKPWPGLAIKFWCLRAQVRGRFRLYLFPIRRGSVKELSSTLFVLLILGQMYCCCVAISFSATRRRLSRNISFALFMRGICAVMLSCAVINSGPNNHCRDASEWTPSQHSPLLYSFGTSILELYRCHMSLSLLTMSMFP
jgi:hypothetical protein